MTHSGGPTAEDVDAVLAGEMGLEVGAVTKRTKLVIATDPDSLSGRARKARDYGSRSLTVPTMVPRIPPREEGVR
ncbi:hypothetical protein SDC9_72248 [bioreactor metagenome]|uniref:Uncharacterized protein n=1 Tax=bioreactor metagenome TaxID=1076179 RepID=A0A644YCS7_9ZZZZ